MKKRKNARTSRGKAKLGHNYKNIQIVRGRPTKSEAEIIKERNKVRLPSLGITDTSTNLQQQISVSWQNISFKDGYIILEYQGQFFQKNIQQSRTYLNSIKAHYSFRNVPEIQAVVKGREVIQILNEEVLFYHVEFLSDTGISFETSYQKVVIKKWSSYTKNYYRNHLAFAFQSCCLDKLCELSDSNLPIIPVGEFVKTSGGTEQIHNSFIFPISSKSGIKLLWESVEESKASYVFEGITDFYTDAQVIYDYIVGGTINKRESLINHCKLQQKLKLNRRIRHTCFSDWNAEIDYMAKT